MASTKSASAKKTSGSPRVIEIELTEDQKKQLIKFINSTGEASLDIGVAFKADLNRGTVAPATFVVGAAV